MGEPEVEAQVDAWVGDEPLQPRALGKHTNGGRDCCDVADTHRPEAQNGGGFPVAHDGEKCPDTEERAEASCIADHDTSPASAATSPRVQGGVQRRVQCQVRIERLFVFDG